MNYPSNKTLTTRLGISREKAKLCRKAMINPMATLEQCPRALQWYNSLYNHPSSHELTMACINDILEGHGVEAIGEFNNYPPVCHFEYINMGDTYTQTICYHKGRYIVQCWGDLVESYNY